MERSSGSGLQFKRRHGDATAAPGVDWAEVDATLREVDPDGALADPRFDPLRHALQILGSVAAEKELDQLREHWLAVDTLVDSVVESHYSGFNKSLQNYSQILRLFSEARAQLAALRRGLEQAQSRLRPQPIRLKELYRKDLMLADVGRLLEDVQAAVTVPDKVKALQDRGEWSLAVATLLDGCNRLAREELAGVGALRSLRADLAHLRESLLAALTAEIERCVYESPAGRGGPATPARPTLRPSAASPAAAAPPMTMPRLRRQGHSLTESPGRAVDATPAKPRAVHRRAATFGGAGAGGGASLIAGSFSGGFGGEGHLLESDVSLSALVNSVAQLGGVRATLNALRAHIPGKMRSSIADALNSFPRSQWLPEEGKRGAGGVGQTRADAATAATAAAVAEAVAARCLASLQSLARALQLLAMARPPAASAGLQMLLGGAPSQPGTPDAAATPSGAAMALQECRYAWECAQMECEAVLGLLLGAPAPVRGGRRALAGTAELPGGGWLAAAAGVLDSEASGADLGGGGGAGGPGGAIPAVTFSLAEETSQPLLPSTVTQANGATPEKSPSKASAAAQTTSTAASFADLSSLLSSIMGGRHGRPELVPAVYQPMTALAADAEQLLAEVAAGDAAGASGGVSTPGGTGPRLSSLLHVPMPWAKVGSSPSGGTPSSPGGLGAAGDESSLLRGFLDNFLRLEFLPAVYVSTRARCRALLDSGDSLKPRVRLRGAYRPGAAVLPAALGAVDMAEEVLGWAGAAPPYATHLAGVLENVLARVLEAFAAAAAAAEGASAAGRLAEDVRVVQVMAKEPAAPLLGAPVAFFVGANVDAMDSFVSSAIAAGFGSSQKGLERELVARVLPASRMVHPESLLAPAGEAARMVALAALADSADYVADTIHAAAAAAAFQAGAGGGAAGGTPGARSAGAAAPRKADAWRRHLPAAWQGAGTGSGAGGGGGSAGLDRDFAEGLAHAADRYRALAGRCIRALRLELILQAAHHLEALPALAAGGPAAAAAEEQVASLARVVSQLDEALAPYLPPDRRMYVFGSLPPAVVTLAVGALPRFSTIDGATVARVCRLLSALQPVLCAAGGVGEGPLPPGAPDPSRQLEKAKYYYSLLAQPADALLAAVAAKPRRFSAEEYSALLAANVPGRRVTSAHRQQLQGLLTGAAAARGTGGA